MFSSSHIIPFKTLTLNALAICFATLFPLSADTSSGEVRGGLDFTQAYEQILEANFEIQAANARVWAKGGEIRQAGARPNPTLEVGLDNFGRFSGGDENELFVGVTQLVELGGKRSARLRVADADQCMSMWELEILRTDLFARVLHAFIDVSVAQEKVEIAKGQEKATEQMLAAVLEKTSSGRTSSVEQKKSEVMFRTAKLAHHKQRANLQRVKRELLSLWNACPPQFEEVNFPLYQLVMPPPLDLLYSKLCTNPKIARVQAEANKASEIVSLERSRSVPDVAFVVGVSTEKFVREPSLTIGFGMPIPIFDRNSGNISRASYEEVLSIYDQYDVLAQLKAELSSVYIDWVAAYEQAIELHEGVLPVAEESFQLARAGYEAGKFDYLHLLDARITLFIVKEQYLEAVENYHHKRADVLRLTGIGS